MAARMPWLKVTATIGGFIGVGYLTMKAVTPTPEQLYERMSPDIRRKVDASRAQRLAAEAAVQQQAEVQAQDPDAQKPIWADTRSRGR